MALDVHVISAGKRWPENGSYAGIGFGDEHEEIFRLAHAHIASTPQLARMKDQYEDVFYEGGDLSCLITELDRIIPSLKQTDALKDALEKYRQICNRAAQENKAILLFAD